MSVQPTTRQRLGTERCAYCQVDTLPDDKTGKCLFCGTQLVELPSDLGNVVRFPINRVRCQCGHGVGAHDDEAGCAGCPCALFTPAEIGQA